MNPEINLLQVEIANLKKENAALKERLRETKKSLVEMTAKCGIYPKETPKALVQKKAKFFPMRKKSNDESILSTISSAIESACGLESKSPISDEKAQSLKDKYCSPRPGKLNFLEAMFTLDGILQDNRGSDSDSDSEEEESKPVTTQLSEVELHSLPPPVSVPIPAVVENPPEPAVEESDYVIVKT